MRRLPSLATLTAIAALAAWSGNGLAQGLVPGTIKLLSKNHSLVDAANGDSFVNLTATEPAKFLIVGPGVLQADFRVGLGAEEKEGIPATLIILSGGKELRRFTIKPRPSMDLWKDHSDVRPAASAGFLMEVDPGPHAYEFRFTGGGKGGALLLVPRAKAHKALAANAPLVPSKPGPAPTPTPAATVQIARATPPPTPPPTPVQTPRSLDEVGPVPVATPNGNHPVATATPEGATEGSAPMGRYQWELALLGGYQLPGDATFKGQATGAVDARWGLGDARMWAVGLEVGHTQFEGVSPTDTRLAVEPFALNVSSTTVVAHLNWYAPTDGAIRPYLSLGGGVVYGQSSYLTRESTTNESKVGPAADGAIGLEFGLGSSGMHEGSPKILVEAHENYANLSFAAHNITNFSSTQVMAGIAMKF